MRAWTALRPPTVESRFDALHATDLTELVGREEELEILLRSMVKSEEIGGRLATSRKCDCAKPPISPKEFDFYAP